MKSEDVLQAAALAVMLERRRGNASVYPPPDVQELFALGRRAAALALKQCNDPRWSDKDEKAQTRCEKRANEIVEPYGLRAEVQGDPRGYCLKLFSTDKRKPLRGNTFGGDESGYGI